MLDSIETAFKKANMPAAVAKRITVVAVRYRNKGKAAAIRRHPFRGICEASGRHLKKEDAHLDELNSEKGYDEKVRWVCPKANNSGRRSCGKC